MVSTPDDELLLGQLPFVGYLVSDVCSKSIGADRDGLAAAGVVGLADAAATVGPHPDAAFGQQARAGIGRALADALHGAEVAVPAGAVHGLRVHAALVAVLGRTPSGDEVASALGVDTATAAAALSADRSTRTWQSTDTELAATILAAESAWVRDRDRVLRLAVDALPEPLRPVVTALYFHDATIEQVADTLGSTSAVVSDARDEALRLLHHQWTAHLHTSVASARPDQAHRPLDRTPSGIGRRYQALLPVLA